MLFFGGFILLYFYICSKNDASTLTDHLLQLYSFNFALSYTQDDHGLLKAETCNWVYTYKI
jgi:hypothetical protein